MRTLLQHPVYIRQYIAYAFPHLASGLPLPNIPHSSPLQKTVLIPENIKKIPIHTHEEIGTHQDRIFCILLF